MYNKYGNIQKMISLSQDDWRLGMQYRLIDIVASYDGKYLIDEDGHKFLNMASCSYLNLDSHPSIIAKSMEMLKNYPKLNINTSRLRLRTKVLDEVESNVADYFNSRIILGTSCTSISEGILPLIAAGVFSDGIKPKMIFDRFAHFSMNIVKAICGDETEVVTCPHNDLNFIEDECKKNKHVAYICDGAYSMGGVAPVKELRKLQEKYNLFIYFDDSHSLSIYGNKGYGVVHDEIKEIDEKTIIVYSLAKAFGAGAGGMCLMGNNIEHYRNVQRYAGPLTWSQPISTANLGSIAGSLEIHRSTEFKIIQQNLYDIMNYFDSKVKTNEKHALTPLRFVRVGDTEYAFKAARKVYEKGFFVSTVFFPIVPKGQAALRVMLNNSIAMEELDTLCKVLNSVQV